MKVNFHFCYTSLVPKLAVVFEMCSLSSLLPAIGLLALLLHAQAALVTRNLTLTWETGAPNGQSRDMIFTNGQFPAPALTFDEDDDVEVGGGLNAWIDAYRLMLVQITVYNQMPQNTTIHWHGIG